VISLRQTIRRALVVLRSVIHRLRDRTTELLVCHGQWSRLSGLSLDAFINYPLNRIIGSCVPAVRKLVTETGLIVCQYTVHHTQYDRLSQQ